MILKIVLENILGCLNYAYYSLLALQWTSRLILTENAKINSTNAYLVFTIVFRLKIVQPIRALGPNRAIFTVFTIDWNVFVYIIDQKIIDVNVL